MKSAFLPSKGLLCLYDKQNNTWLFVDMEFLFSCSTQHLTRSLRSLVSYRVTPSKKNSISTRAHVLFSISHINCGVIQGFLALRKAVATHVKKYRILSHVDIANQLLTRHSLCSLVLFSIFCGLKSPAYNSGGTELDVCDT